MTHLCNFRGALRSRGCGCPCECERSFISLEGAIGAAPLQTGDPFEAVSAVGVILYLQSVRMSHRPAFTRKAENASCLFVRLPCSWSVALRPRSLSIGVETSCPETLCRRFGSRRWQWQWARPVAWAAEGRFWGQSSVCGSQHSGWPGSTLLDLHKAISVARFGVHCFLSLPPAF